MFNDKNQFYIKTVKAKLEGNPDTLTVTCDWILDKEHYPRYCKYRSPECEDRCEDCDIEIVLEDLCFDVKLTEEYMKELKEARTHFLNTNDDSLYESVIDKILHAIDYDENLELTLNLEYAKVTYRNKKEMIN
ncbi:hypothetical protein [Caldicellulosiruptor morganii]|uniref:Phage protein n=1 Tax=Caldicellulosiruptor morganii TaxID=1387555 RepID=A0ABY7BMV9_9FIRM|nr:hypothetical protein [Caldicellulosiruptor morganii]WAM33914.1 hypothetical protein OTK00_000054 [Caldicellulosiruptor morganii]